ncbi:MAG: hypothetical protein AAF492_05430, partial [Verrucomicrobiota bacterium]
TVSGASLNLNATQEDVGLYSSSSFGSAAAMQDFVQYGAAGDIGRTDVAVAKGIWTLTEAVPTPAPGSSIQFDGAGNGATNWMVSATPSLGANNTNAICEAGTIDFMSGGTSAVICVGDGSPDPMTVRLNGAATTANTGFFITDNQGDILAFTTDPVIDLDGAPPGTCRVYGFVSLGEITNNAMGTSVYDASAVCCADLSDNWVEIVRETADGGTLGSDQGLNVTICKDGTPDPVTVTNDSTSGLSYAYIITDNTGMVLAFPPGNVIDLDGAPPGVCRVYGISYAGTLDTTTGVPIGTVGSDDCFDLSSNWIEITRNEADGGGVGSDLGLDVAICKDGIPDPVTVTNTSGSGLNYAYVITDDAGMVLVFPGGNVIDLDGAPLGVCRVYGISFSGTLDTTTGVPIGSVSSDECFDLSTNWVTITRTVAQGGTLDSDQGLNVTICKDGNPDPVTVTNDSTSALSYAYIITDNAGNVLVFPAGNVIDLDGAPPGICRVYGISYSGTLDTTTGVPVGSVSSDECFELSANWVTITRQQADGGGLGSDQGLDVAICKDGLPDPVTITNTSISGLNYAYVITDDAGMVLVFPGGNVIDLDGAPLGVCRVYGISFSGTLDTNTGVHISAVTSDECFDLSTNWVTITRTVAEGGTLDSDQGLNVTICKDGTPDPVVVTSDSTSALEYAYIITDNTGMVLAFPPGNVVDLDSAPLGVCRVYGISYSGTLDTTTGVPIGSVTSDECFELSSNWVEITRVEGGDGGTVGSDRGLNPAICKDGIPDPITVTNTSSSGFNYAYIVTDDADTVLAFPPGNVIDLDGAPIGICRVYGISYSGTLNSTTGVNIASITSDGCSDLSDNYVRITRSVADGGDVGSDEGLNVSICKDGIPDPVTMSNTSSSGLSYAYVITDDSGMVLAFPPGNIVDLDGAPLGVCRVYGISYSGTLDTTTGVPIGSVSSDECFELSANWVTITRTVAEGGTLGSDQGLNVTICKDGNPDPVT